MLKKNLIASMLKILKPLKFKSHFKMKYKNNYIACSPGVVNIACFPHVQNLDCILHIFIRI